MTWLLQLLGSLARVFTTLTEASAKGIVCQSRLAATIETLNSGGMLRVADEEPDPYVLYPFVFAAVGSGIVVAQIVFYRKATAEHLKKMSRKRD